MELDGGCFSSCRAAVEERFEIEGDVVTVDKDKAAALEWWRKTAEQGCSKCRGKAAAAMWYSKAAAQGHAEAQFEIGWCYFEGDGVKVDKVAALEWWLKAAENGNANAQFNMGVHYSSIEYQKESGVSLESLHAAGSAWFRKAAKTRPPSGAGYAWDEQATPGKTVHCTRCVAQTREKKLPRF